LSRNGIHLLSKGLTIDLHKTAIYPGTFDPITNGHIDIIRRASAIFSRVIVTLAVNSSKATLFTTEERLAMLREATAGLANVEVAKFSGLVVEFARQVGATVMVRGLRAVSDFEYEFQMALMNRKQEHSLDTVFLMPDEKYTYLSSSIVREIARHGGTIECFVPKFVEDRLKAKSQNGQ